MAATGSLLRVEVESGTVAALRAEVDRTFAYHTAAAAAAGSSCREAASEADTLALALDRSEMGRLMTDDEAGTAVAAAKAVLAC